MIYFIGNRDLNLCKIGFSEKPNKRIESIKSSMPFELEIFAIKEGSRKDEKELHNIYSEYRLRGEWFLLSYIKDINAKYETINILGCNILKEDDYFNLSSVLNEFNSLLFKECKKGINITQFFNTTEIKMFISSMKEKKIEPIKDNGFGKWIHKYLFVELARKASPKIKLSAYQYILKDANKNLIMI